MSGFRASAPPDGAPRARRDQVALLVLALLGALALGAWIRSDWHRALDEAGLEFEHLARSNSLSVALAARDAQRFEQSVDARLTAGQTLTAALLRQELQERFGGDEVADFVPARPGAPVLSTDTVPVDASVWQAQLPRVAAPRETVVGWAYQRGQAWMLPVFYRRADGSLLVVSLPVAQLLAEWTKPDPRVQAALGLRAHDDHILLREPLVPGAIGARASGTATAEAIAAAALAGRTSGHVLARATETDRVERLIAWAEVPRTRAWILVAGSRQDLLARWLHQRAPAHLLAVLLLGLAVVVVAWSRGRLQRAARAEADARRAAEQGLQTLQRMCRLARIGPWTADPATGVLEMGPGARELYGMAPDAPVARWFDFACADEAARGTLEAARRRLLSEGVGYDLVLPLTLPGGEQRWLRSTAVAVRGADGRIERVDGALQDVTDSVRTRADLEQKDRRLRELALVVSSSRQLLLSTDAAQRITWCNAAFERVSGYTIDEIRGQHPGRLLQRGAVPDAVRATMREAIAARRPVVGVRVRNVSKSGRAYWVDLEITPVFDEAGELQSYIGLQTDVTADIEREHAMRQIQERNELATRNARIGIFERDVLHRETRWNDMMFELTGFPASGTPPAGRQVQERIPAAHRAATAGLLRRAIRDPGVARLDFECPYEPGPGAVRWLRNQCVIERDANGRATRLVGTLLDVTVARELGEERRARLEADARNAAKTAFLSSMSHELRTPLNAVIGYAQIVAGDASGDIAPLRARVARIEAAGWHLLALIDDILDLARIEAGTTAIERRPVALAEVVADALDLVAAPAEARRITLDAETADAWIHGDVKRLRQVVSNLLSNAIKYNVDGGRVEVRLAHDGQLARIHVRDTGLGMTPQQLGQLYQPFNRLGRETSGVPGTGIGLTITRTLVGLMGGTIDVSSEPGRGTDFVIAFPLAEPADTPARAAPPVLPAPRPAPSPLRVLCVEDNEVNALVLQESVKLLRPGWTVQHMCSLERATEFLQGHAVDLVVLDQNLPDGLGLDWLEAQRRAGRLQPQRVVLLTADAMPALRAEAMALGVRFFMTKPFDLPVFDALLDELVGALQWPPDPVPVA